ncbi:ribonuclease [Lachnospiraceae bacterium NSJ-29]|uniref:Ribonuclease n=1 Tax=Wansuia hejianensis TaxID=2763667 RepID=A0A926F0S9_9FIRM|nr:ribonuclease [Wansuia hejianensis]
MGDIDLKRILSLLLIILLSFSLTSCISTDLSLEDKLSSNDTLEKNADENIIENISEDGHYNNKEDVSLYIHTYGKLPGNYITKREAIELGWESNKGNLWDVTDKMSIGGDRFGNREGKLPVSKGRQYYECDINYQGGYRGPERIVYSNDGLVYYTEDHYESFILLYGDE